MTFNQTQFAYLDAAALFDLVAHEAWAVMLDSGTIARQPSSRLSWGYDVLAVRPYTTLVYDGSDTEIRHGTAPSRSVPGDPLDIVKAHMPAMPDQAQDLPYMPGALGYFSYDLARTFESLPAQASDAEQLPPMAVGLYSVIVVIDHAKHQTVLISDPRQSGASELFQHWVRLIKVVLSNQGEENPTLQSSCHPANQGGLRCDALAASFSESSYQKAFERVKQYIVEGDCYQVNLTNQFATSAHGDAWKTYQYLRQISPAPYGAYLNLPFATVLSNSPESFIQCRDREVVTSPIKGTRPRVRGNALRDQEVAQSLLNSPKDRAENLMIVDLMRNDLSRSCVLGSVQVPELFALHSFANVHHLISRVTGRLRDNLHALDLLRRCFPGGSITGAPKIRSMQIIEELEPCRRGLYCGAIGYLGIDGSLETNIAIRTMVVKDGVVRFGAGGGLVIDSDAKGEYQELLDKASKLLAALFPEKADAQ
ncbi:aminodeoxychorismate synthase subunit I [Arenicella chitinivorans]|uniref:aminodeoxychorismate synthase n=1 Tax=Arenicella chitinivorans TaxID=1329800 RepID=A0A918RQ94_9GAMM|nr:aminodeoxychorismate synthase component I [Arenicella chitinivorans]GHA08765.1 aminodeoxychorismate synthase subunit I [Arenicella chitinivorans]